MLTFNVGNALNSKIIIKGHESQQTTYNSDLGTQKREFITKEFNGQVAVV